MEDMQIVVKGLTQGCLGKLEVGADGAAREFRCCIALLASILDLNHSIVIKLEYSNIKTHINKLASNFQVQDFLTVN